MSFEHLKAGDKVIVCGTNRNYLHKVERMTATQIIVSDGSRYRRTTGNRIGGNTWHFAYLIEHTEAEEQKIMQIEHRAKLLGQVCDINWRKCSIDQLERIVAIYNEGNE